jgi:hypothetical protein
MTAASLRASYSISASTLTRFNAVFSAGERSHVVESYMQRAVAAKEKELASMAESYLSDPAFALCRADEKLWDVTASDGLSSE